VTNNNLPGVNLAAFQKNSDLVEISMETPKRVGILITFLVFGVFGVWAAIAPISGAAHGSGLVTVKSYKKLVQHLEGGLRAPADRDVVGQRHQDHGQEGREAFVEIGDVDALDLREHQVAHQDQGRRRGLARDDPREWRKGNREQEQDAGDHRCEACAGTVGHAGGALDVRGVRRHAGQAADDRCDAVDHQDRRSRGQTSQASRSSATR